jgi:predicted Zn-dependent peptidase
VAASDPADNALAVLNRILGVGASSRLFQRLREEEGLTYDIWSGVVLRAAGGLLEVGWACAPDALAAAWQLVRAEIARIVDDIAEHEVEVAKEGLERCLLIDAETVGGLCSMDVAEALERGRRLDVDRLVDELRAVSHAEVVALARRVLRADQMATAVCGPRRAARLVA